MATGLAILFLFAFQLYAFHWGVITPDTVEQYRQALTGQYEDWHPPITTWIWRQLLGLHSGSAPYLIFDLLLYWSAIGLFAAHFHQRYGHYWALVPIFLAAVPIPFGQTGAILKDPLLASTCLLAAAFVIGCHGKARLLALPLIILASAMRFNAIFATVPLLTCLLPPMLTAGVKRTALAAIATGLLLLASSWAINVAALQPHRAHPIFSLVNFDLAGIVAHGGANGYPITRDADTARRCYDARLYNPHNRDDCNIVEDDLAAYAQDTGHSALAIWIDAIANAPLAYIHHRIAHLNWNWRLLVPSAPKDAVYIMSEPNALGLAFKPNGASRFVGSTAQWVAETPLGRPATWIAIAFGLLIIADFLPSARAISMLAGSSLLYGLAYGVVSVAPDMRYNLWTMLAAMLGAAIALAEFRTSAIAALTRKRIIIAFAPSGTIILLEAIWLIFQIPAFT